MPVVSLPSGRQYPAEIGESLLAAALRAEITLEHSCRTGRCSSCKARVLSGSTAAIHDELGLSKAERDAGWILTCARAATSNVQLDIADLGNVKLFPAKKLPCRIHTLELLAANVIKVVLRVPPSAELKFFAGQYVELIGANGLRRSYSIANAPAPHKQIELHVRRVPGGAMSDYLFDRARLNDLLWLDGPLGTFFLREIDDLDLVFLATGTGIAPVKAMLEDLAEHRSHLRPRSVSVLWGGRLRDDIYWNPMGIDIEHRFVPVLSRAASDWHGARGHVQQILLGLSPDLSRSVVYACGSEAMIQSAAQQLAEAGLHEGRFHSDAFVSSSSTNEIVKANQ